jgi:hypothetical protein
MSKKSIITKSPQENSIDFDKLLPELDKRTKDMFGISSDYCSRALYYLILDNREHLEGFSVYYFHKAFRQIDVTPTGNLDMAFYSLLNGARIFWEIIEELYSSTD